MRIRLPREDGAWWVAVICWVSGWAATRQAAWEPLAIAGTVVFLFAAAQILRSIRRLWEHDPRAARRRTVLLAALLIPPAGALALYTLKTGGNMWALVPVFPALLYTGAIISGSEKVPISRVLGMSALSGLAPATYAMVTGGMDATAWLLWATLGGYFILSGILVMARLRRSTPALWTVRVVSVLAVVTALVCPARGASHFFLAAVFVLLAIKAWTVRTTVRRVDPRRVGQSELLHSAIVLILIFQAFGF